MIKFYYLKFNGSFIMKPPSWGGIKLEFTDDIDKARRYNRKCDASNSLRQYCAKFGPSLLMCDTRPIYSVNQYIEKVDWEIIERCYNEVRDEQDKVMEDEHLFPKRIGFAGAHRVGKSSLAKEIAKELDYKIVDTSTRNLSIWPKLDNDYDNLTFAERYIVQEAIKDHFVELFESHSNNHYVADRTFLDVGSYLLANIDSTTSDLFDVSQFITAGLFLDMDRAFDHTFIVQPAIPVIQDGYKAGKTFLSNAYMESLNAITIGLAAASLIKGTYTIIPRGIVSLEERVDFCLKRLHGLY